MKICQIILGLGSNCEPRYTFLMRACDALRADAAISDLRASPVYETPALLPVNAPAEWNIPYLNQVITAYTYLEPLQLLQWTQALEHRLGRTRRGRWGPREIDIDILHMEGVQREDPRLTLPHAEMLKRAFVMVPLADLLPEWVHPLEPYRRSAQAVAAVLRAEPAQALQRWHEDALKARQ